MDRLASFGDGTTISAIAEPTFKMYDEILSKISHTFIEPVEYPYGPRPRQKLDVYMPPSSYSTEAEAPDGPDLANRLPVVVWIHGGGVDKCAKRMPMPRGMHNNCGHFFAAQGFVTVSQARLSRAFG